MRVLITGASGALGHAVVRRFAEYGWRVASLGTSADRDDGRFVAGDLAEEHNAKQVVDDAAAWLGGIDAFVHLAGAFRWIEVGSSTLADWRALFDANVATAVATTNAVRPHLLARASMVFVGARSAEPAGAGFGPYAAAKSGVARLAEALSRELAPRIRVNVVLPAIIDTPQNRADMPDVDPSLWTSPDAVADAIVFLATPASRAVNGALLPVGNPA
ncbi:SDR family NAD(P)-dependent oxidoreductase [Sphingomonas sp. Leaf208]|uniref:SDR family NAD(P)-dependent oxidoreductase n=1 Tax=Sphingomonas sp. Leaf208 TaxID=1735679 RepID=UPI000A530763|nr:SDR family NAD(P)-dependent oxidoreductase [Sphingomonas sp. Leaf208]